MLVNLTRIFSQFFLVSLLIFVLPIEPCLPTSSVSNPVTSTTEAPTSTTEASTETSTTVTEMTTETTSTTEVSSTTEEISSTTEEVSSTTTVEEGVCLKTDVTLSLGNNDDPEASVESINYVPTTTNGVITSATMTVVCSTTAADFFVQMAFDPTATPTENGPGFPKTISINLFCSSETNQWLYRDVVPVDAVICTPTPAG